MAEIEHHEGAEFYGDFVQVTGARGSVLVFTGDGEDGDVVDDIAALLDRQADTDAAYPDTFA